MAFNVKNPEADQLLRELTEVTGESLTDAIIVSLRERLDRQRRLRGATGAATLEEAIDRLAALPAVDDRSEDEILGYDRHGLPA
jgi:antitoxin VapB